MTHQGELVRAGWLTLRSPQPPDASWLYHACQDPEIGRWTRIPVPYRPGDAVAFLEFARACRDEGQGHHFVIEVTETGELLGACGVDLGTDRPEIGYWLVLDGRGRGVATAAVAALSDWCATELGLSELWATVKVGNDRSEAVLERCGFRCVSRMAECVSARGAEPATRWLRQLRT